MALSTCERMCLSSNPRQAPKTNLRKLICYNCFVEDLEIYIASPSEFDKFYDYFSASLYKDFPDIRKEVMDFYISEGYPREGLRELMIRGKRTIFLARIKDEIIGYIMILQDWGGVSIALWLAVDENFRGRGIGKALLKLWEETSKKNNNHALLLYTTADHNRKFYSHMGFTEAGFLPNFWFNIGHYIFYKHI